MKNTTQTHTPKTMLYINSLLSSKEYNLNTKDQLRISEASATSQKSEVIPLDMIEASPATLDEIDPQILAFTFVCGIASGVFAMMSWVTGISVTSLFSAIFFIASLASLYLSFNKKVRSYTYHYVNTNTPLFTLNGNQANSVEVAQFVKTLSESIQISTTSIDDTETNNPQETSFEKNESSSEEQEYLTYTYHLDYLYTSGLIDEVSYRRIGQNITDRIFGREKQETTSSNIINFPR